MTMFPSDRTSRCRTARSSRLAALVLPLAALAAACDDPAGPEREPLPIGPAANATTQVVGAVYTSTNAANGNEVLVFPRNADGTLGAPTPIATGGLGSGAGDLGSQGAVVLSPNGQWLLVVNAGSNDVSLFSVSAQGITLTDVEPSGGTMPVSATISRGTVYVLNAGGVNNVTGFWIENGDLRPIPNSTRSLSAASTGPAQVEFDPTGTILVVTEKATNVVATFDVARPGGTLGQGVFNPSNGATPFGFAFDRLGRLFISEAFGGMPGASAVSSYTLGSAQSLALISGSVGNGQTAACWVVVTPDGRLAFTTNTGSGNVSAYEIGTQGAIHLVQPVAANTGAGSAPIDMALAGNGQFLYVLAPGNATVRPYAVHPNGTLTGLGPVSGIAPSAFGLAAW